MTVINTRVLTYLGGTLSLVFNQLTGQRLTILRCQVFQKPCCITGIMILLLSIVSCKTEPKQEVVKPAPKKVTRDYTAEIAKLESFTNHNTNKNYFFLVDFSIHSGKKRFLVYDRNQQKIIKKYMVAHGSGNKQKRGVPTIFSNVPESHCSSLGVGIVNSRAYSNWGIHVKYWVDGLEATNDNMRKRLIVLHSYGYVPSVETYPIPIINSEGCFMVSNKDMTSLDSLIDSQDNKRILLYSFI